MEPASAVQVIDYDNPDSTYYFWDLPKYNEYGKIVRYDVIEGVRKKDSSDPGAVIPIAQFVRENNIDTDYTFGHVQTSYKTNSDMTPDDQAITVTNRLSGTKQVYFWKEWNDAYRYQMSPTQRPDIYLGLYRYNKVTRALDQLYSEISWTFYDDEFISLSDFGNLAKYDEQGNEYIYYAREYVKIEDKESFDYKDVYYKYDNRLENPELSDTAVDEILNGLSSIGNETAEAVKSEGSWVDTDGNALMMKTTDDVNLLKEYGAFVNDIEANVNISGKKIWANVPVGFEDEDLIPVTFYIFQYTDDIPVDEDYLTNTADGTERFDSRYSGDDANLPYLNGKKAYAWVTIQDWELQKYLGEYKFSIEYVGKNTNDVIQTADEVNYYADDKFVKDKYGTDDDGKANLAEGDIVVKPSATDEGVIPPDSAYLPKYDDKGNLYTYVLRESGYFGDSDADNDDTEGDGRDYVFAQPIMNNFAITNAYTTVLGELSVRKILDLSDFENLDDLGDIPAVSFTLTRSYASTDDKSVMVQDKEFSREITFNTTDFEKIENEDNVFVHEYTFENLEIYAPNGNKYEYTITENPKLSDESHLIQGGYEAYGDTGWYELEVTKELNPDEIGSNAYLISGLYAKPSEDNDGNIVENLINGIGDFFTGIGEFIGITPKQNPSSNDTSWAAFKNVYEKEPAPLEFSKKWDDYGQSGGRFTTPLTFEVRQWADAQPGQDNAINTKNTLMGKFTITLKEKAKDQSSVTLTKGGNDYGSISINPNVTKDENVLNYIQSVTVCVDNLDPSNPQTLPNNSNWKITIESFQTYAPNGMPWQYQLKEVDVYPYVISNATMEFKYDGTQFVKTSPSGTLTNSSKVTIKATKNITTTADPDADYTSGVPTVWNYTGFDVRVNFDVYATFVQADSWEEAMSQMLPKQANGYTNTAWVNLHINETAEYRDDLIKAMNEKNDSAFNPTFTASVTFDNNSSFGKKSASYSNLPKVFNSADGKTVYASYILMETSIELIDGKKADGITDNVVYREEMTPSFVQTKVPEGIQCSSTAYKAGDAVIAYYYPNVTASILTKDASGTETMNHTEYKFMKPVFDSKEDVTGIEADSQILNFDFRSYEEWLPYVWIGKYDSNNAGNNTFINDEFNTYETMNLNVRKYWKKMIKEIFTIPALILMAMLKTGK